MKEIKTLGTAFTTKHEWLLQIAKENEVAICGGCAAAISKERSDYIPSDLDLVTTKANALRFVDAINHFLLGKNIHYRIYINSHNKFVPIPAIAHFRIQCPFWVPVCLFVLPYDKFRYYRINEGYLLQLPKDVKAAADALTETDNKARIANEDVKESENIEAKEKPEEFNDIWTIKVKVEDDFDNLIDSQHYSTPN